MTYEFGFIGTGHMGGALARAVCRGAGAEAVVLANRSRGKAEALARELGCAVGENEDAARARFLFLGVKPQGMKDLLTGVSPLLRARRDGFVLVSMAAGLSMDSLAALAGGAYPIVRLMPNTPVAAGEGVVLYDCNDAVSPGGLARLLEALAPAGLIEHLEERLIDAASCVAGCGPAFLDLFLEALADGGVACGLPRATALRCAAQMALGAAKLALETGAHPGALKDAVCSPAGSTIQGVRALERAGFRSALIEAVIAACEKTKEMA